ncbi:MAG: DUF4199 domain-containing protein [Polaribacter sp.]|uniref:DUF4199 domain-containing protein n=1 Tax=Polaribacter sp. TaxID=1920175 RepID=UPI003BAEFDC4
MENQANSKSIILNYGLYTGISSILIAVILYALGKSANPGIALGIVSFVIPLVILVLGIKKFKDANNGFMSWGQGVKVGVGIALIWGVLALAFQLILENIIDPNLIEQKLEVTRVTLENFGMTQEVIEEQLEKARNQNPLLASAYAMLFFAFIGFLVSAIAAAIMKKSEEETY